jgi:hypothetical protein
MPVDLEDMFAALGRDADSVPVAPAEQARRRGRQRTRTTAMVAAAATAVGLVTTGIGVTARHDDGTDRPVHPAASDQALPAVGSPLTFPSLARVATTAGADGREYTAWQSVGGPTEVNAVDLRTGAVVWSAGELGSAGDSMVGTVAMPQGVVVTLAPADGAAPDSTMYVLNPADGRQRWKLTFTQGDNVVYHRAALIRMSARTGVTEAFDWTTGAVRWSLPATADRPIRTMGTHVPADQDLAGGSRLPAGYTDNRLVQVTEGGQVQVRTVTTGALLRTATIPAPGEQSSYYSYDGRLYNDEQTGGAFRIRATDLRTGHGRTDVVLTPGAGYRLGGFTACGPDRVCVLDQDGGRATVTAVDVAQRRQLWRVDAPAGARTVDSMHGRTLVTADATSVVLDSDGRPVFRAPDAVVGWLDADTMLVLPARTAGTVSTVRLTDRRLTRLGDIPGYAEQCAWTTERLACPTSESLHIWSLAG